MQKRQKMKRNKNILRRGILTFFMIGLCSFYSCSKYKTMNNGIVLRLKEGALKLQVCSDRIVRVVYDPSGRFRLRKSLVVTKDWGKVRFEVRAKKDVVEIGTDKIVIQANRETGVVSFYDSRGRLLLQEDPERPRAMSTAHVLGEETYHGQQNFKFSAGEGLYGLGQLQDGIMNYRSHEVVLTQANTIAVVPFLISTRNYGILWDNYSKTKFSDTKTGSFFWSEVADAIDYYFIAGSNLDDVIRGYREATGPAPLFGKWAYGYWQSKERYRTGEELMSVVREYRRRNIPIDNIIQDWLYWGDEDDWCAMRFDENKFPDAAGMIEQIHQKYNMHFMLSIWPVLGNKTEIYEEMKAKGYLYKPIHWTKGRVYDAYNEDARRIYWRYVDQGLFSKGVDAFWMDATEPEIEEAGEIYIKRAGRNALGTMARYLNTYSLLTTKGVYEGQRSVTSDKRVFILTRSAFAGQQRYAAATWSGDIVSDWKVFRNQISAGLNFCMAGIPYWTTDIGAFYVKQNGAFEEGCKDPAYQEMYVRWFQYGAFCPIFRSHGTHTPREIWQFGEPGSWPYETLLKYDRLRYRLLPYIYSLAWKVTSEGYTLMRGLPLDFGEDSNVHAIDDQFMFGPGLLINPVTEHMYYGEDYINEVIPLDRLYAADGRQGGLTINFFNGENFDTPVAKDFQKSAEFNAWGEGMPKGLNETKYSIRWTGEVKSKGAGQYEFWLSIDDGMRFLLDNKLLVDEWGNQGGKTHKIKVTLKADTNYKIRIDYVNRKYGTNLRLAWRTPEMIIPRYHPDRVKKRTLYLPQSKGWFDFWTGEQVEGGKTVDREAPIGIMPIYVKAGSIIPMGPKIQYTTEKPADPIELRVYTEADAEFVLYEDDNDNYNYEKGIYATIPIKWDERTQALSIGQREGKFPGMLEKRTFQIVWVSKNHGVGLETPQKPDVVVIYDGSPLKVMRRPDPLRNDR